VDFIRRQFIEIVDISSSSKIGTQLELQNMYVNTTGIGLNEYEIMHYRLGGLKTREGTIQYNCAEQPLD